MRKALVFPGQGTQRAGMCQALVRESRRVAALWSRMTEQLYNRYGVHMQAIVHDNPVTTHVYSDALDVARVCDGHVSSNNANADANAATGAHVRGESHPRSRLVTHPRGVLAYSYLTQPCVLAAQLVALEALKERGRCAEDLSDVTAVAGHSLGELTALCALGVWSPEVAVTVAYQRGLLMEDAVGAHERDGRRYLMYACNPLRARLDTLSLSLSPSSSSSSSSVAAGSDDNNNNGSGSGSDGDGAEDEAQWRQRAQAAEDMLCVLVELIARALSHTTSFVELSSCNVRGEQLVVAGDAVGMAVLGSCLDPQFRAQHRDACARAGMRHDSSSSSSNSSSNHSNHSDANATSSVTHTAASLAQLVHIACARARADAAAGLTPALVNAPPAEPLVTTAYRVYGTRALMRRFVRGPDDGATPPLSELTHLTLTEEGRSGLKRKTWFTPVQVELPFHTSRLRHSMDKLLPVLRATLPEEAQLRACLGLAPDRSSSSSSICASAACRPRWVTNLTGTTFDPSDATFQSLACDAVDSLNVGENAHVGRYHDDVLARTLRDGLHTGSVRDVCAAVLAAQGAHTVQWATVMDTLVCTHGCRDVCELSHVRNVADLLRRSRFVTTADDDSSSSNCSSGGAATATAVTVRATCFPADRTP